MEMLCRNMLFALPQLTIPLRGMNTAYETEEIPHRDLLELSLGGNTNTFAK
jgi:hypothetical protein